MQIRRLRPAQTAVRVLVAAMVVVLHFTPPAVARATATSTPTCTIQGTSAAETLTGTPGNDVICTGGGNDTVNAGAGNDIVIAEGGSVIVVLGPGDDTFDGSDAIDATVDGDDGNDTITGTPGEDELDGGAGDDTIIGGEANDTLNGGDGADKLSGSAGGDLILGESGSDAVDGGTGDDVLGGGEGIDAINGGAGLNTCDFTTGEKPNASCTYDSKAPDLVSFSLMPPNVDVSVGDAITTVTARVSDVSGISRIEYTCQVLGGPFASASLSRSLNSPSGWRSDDHNGNSWGSYTPSLSGSIRDLTVSLPMTFKKGSRPGPYSCTLLLKDGLGYTRSIVGQDNKVVPRIRVVRSPGNWDDYPPALVSFQLDRTTVEVGEHEAVINLRAHVTDQTGLEQFSFSCGTDKTGYGDFMAGLFYRPIAERGSNWRSFDTHSSSAKDSWDVDVTGTPQDFVVTLPITIPEGFLPGQYDCLVQMRDSLMQFGWIVSGSTSSITVPKINVTRASGIYDDDPPEVVSFVLSTLTPDVGVGDVKVFATIHLKDSTKIDRFELSCFSPGDEFATGINLQRTPQNNGWRSDDLGTFEVDLSPEVSGSVKELTATLPMTFRGGTQPGLYQCNVYVSDSIHSRQIRSTLSESVPDVTVFRTPAGLPSMPENLAFAINRATAGLLSWREPSIAGEPRLTHYVVEYRQQNSSTWLSLSGGVTSRTSIAISGLRASSEYLFRVRAENGATSGADLTYMRLNWALLEVRTPDPVTPAAPTTFTTGTITTTSAVIRWIAPTDNGGSPITDYVVETSRDGSTWSTVPHTASAATSMTLSGLAPGTTYQVRVATKTAVGTSETLSGSVTTLAGLPSAPQTLAATSVAATTLTLTWKLPSSNGGSPITDYKIEVSSNGGSTWSAIPHTASNSRAFNVTGLAKGTSYRFRVSTITAIGTSVSTSALSVTTVGNPPPSPTTLKVTATTTTTVTLSWSQAAVVNGSAVRNYTVEYSTNSGSTWTVASKPVSTSKSVTLSGFRTKTTYRFRVKAINDVGGSGYSNTITVATR